MKNLFSLLIIACLFSSCAQDKTIDRITYRSYGLLNPELKVDSVVYSVPISGVLCGVIFFECVLPPVYIFGYNLYQADYIKSTVSTIVPKSNKDTVEHYNKNIY